MYLSKRKGSHEGVELANEERIVATAQDKGDNPLLIQELVKDEWKLQGSKTWKLCFIIAK